MRPDTANCDRDSSAREVTRNTRQSGSAVSRATTTHDPGTMSGCAPSTSTRMPFEKSTASKSGQSPGSSSSSSPVYSLRNCTLIAFHWAAPCPNTESRLRMTRTAGSGGSSNPSCVNSSPRRPGDPRAAPADLGLGCGQHAQVRARRSARSGRHLRRSGAASRPPPRPRCFPPAPRRACAPPEARSTRVAPRPPRPSRRSAAAHPGPGTLCTRRPIGSVTRGGHGRRQRCRGPGASRGGRRRGALQREREHRLGGDAAPEPVGDERAELLQRRALGRGAEERLVREPLGVEREHVGGDRERVEQGDRQVVGVARVRQRAPRAAVRARTGSAASEHRIATGSRRACRSGTRSRSGPGGSHRRGGAAAARHAAQPQRGVRGRS